MGRLREVSYTPSDEVQQRDIKRILDYIKENLSYLNVNTVIFEYDQQYSKSQSRKYRVFTTQKSKTSLNFDVSDTGVRNVP